MSSDLAVCLNGCDLRGSPIPEEHQNLYGGASHFSRLVGIYDQDADRTVEWLCPDCGVRWPR